MTAKPQDLPSQPWSRRKRWAFALLLAAGFVGLVVSQLPGGAYPTDLSRIGSGRPVLVLAQDSNYSGGMVAMEAMNAIRGDYAGRVDFLVAHLGMADGQAFARQHAARDGTVLLFANDGRPVSVLNQPQSAEELRRALQQAFGL